MKHYRELPGWQRCLVLLWEYCKISALVVGGGYAIISAAQEVFVRRYHWLDDDEILEMITVTQTVPGILAVNSAVYVGKRIGGVPGACAALIGASLPPFIIIVLVAAGLSGMREVIDSRYVQGAFKGVIGCITGMVIVTALNMRKKAVKGAFGRLVALGCFIGMAVFGFSPVFLILAAVGCGLGKVWRERRNAS